MRASPAALQAVSAGIEGWMVVRIGNRVGQLWLKGADGQFWLIDVDQRDVRPMFEVFGLAITSLDELTRRWRQWQPPMVDDSFPAWLQQMLSTRPAPPVAPQRFDAWPFRSWHTDVVRRAEFIVEGENDGSTFGNGGNVQAAAPPGQVPAEAAASCDVAVGLLFTGDCGRMLIAADWMPMNLAVLDDEATIDAFLETCELVDMTSYAGKIASS